MAINRFTGIYRFLSNFYESPVYLNGIEYKSVEHAYQATKTFNPQASEAIRNTYSPGDARILGRQVTMRADFSKIKIPLMEYLVRNKFANSPSLTLDLLGTGNVELIEGNTWGDKFWGVCGGKGQNHLGKILMRVRQEIIEGRMYWDQKI